MKSSNKEQLLKELIAAQEELIKHLEDRYGRGAPQHKELSAKIKVARKQLESHDTTTDKLNAESWDEIFSRFNKMYPDFKISITHQEWLKHHYAAPSNHVTGEHIEILAKFFGKKRVAGDSHLVLLSILDEEWHDVYSAHRGRLSFEEAAILANRTVLLTVLKTPLANSMPIGQARDFVRDAVIATIDGVRGWIDNESVVVRKGTDEEIPDGETVARVNGKSISEYVFPLLKAKGITLAPLKNEYING